MINDAYLLDKAAPPPEWRRFADLHLLPKAINGAAAAEQGLHTLADHVRRRPRTALMLACGVALLASTILFGRRDSA